MEKFKIKITVSNEADGVNICQFIDNLDRHHKVVLLSGGICLPFDNVTNMLMKRFIAQGGGGRIPNEGRYGCEASAKPWPDKIFPKTQCPGKKCPKT